MYTEVKKKLSELQPVEVKNFQLKETGMDDLKKLFRPRMLSRHNRRREEDGNTLVLLSDYLEGNDTIPFLSAMVSHRGTMVTQINPALSISPAEMKGSGLSHEDAVEELVMDILPCLPFICRKMASLLEGVGMTIQEDAFPESIPESILGKVRKPMSVH